MKQSAKQPTVSQGLVALRGFLTIRLTKGGTCSQTDLEDFAKAAGVTMGTATAMWLKLRASHHHPENVHETVITVPLFVTTAEGAERGQLFRMRLTLLQHQTGPGPNDGWLAGAETICRLEVASEFEKSLDDARSAINSLDPEHPLWRHHSGIVVLWDFVPPPNKIEGESAGSIIALGLIELFRRAKLIPQAHRVAGPLDWKTREPLQNITAIAKIDSLGGLLPVNEAALKHKLSAEGATRLGLVILSRNQPSPPLMASAATDACQLRASNLQEALFLISADNREQRGVMTVKPRRWLRKFLPAALIGIAILFWMASALLPYYPLRPYLELRLPRGEVKIDPVSMPLPEGCEHLFHLDDLSAYQWEHNVQPILGPMKWPYALVVGDPFGIRPEQANIQLREFGTLGSVKTLALLHSNVVDLQGLENLKNVVRLVVMGNRVRDLDGARKLDKLKSLVLNSGFLERYPAIDWRFAFPELEDLIIHLPRGQTYIDLTNCPNLARLAIAGGDLEEVSGIESLTKLKELIIYSERLHLDTLNGLPSDNRIERVEIGLSNQLDAFDVSAFPQLKTLAFKGTSLREVLASQKGSKLKSLIIEEAPHLDSLDVSGFPSLQDLSVDAAPLDELTGLAAVHELQSLHFKDVELTNLDELDSTSDLKSIVIEGAKMLACLHVSGVTGLQSLKVRDSALQRVTGLEKLVGLIELSITESPLTSVSGIEHLRSLKKLDVSNTPLKSFPSLIGLENLGSIALDHTAFETLPELGSTKECSVTFEGTAIRASKPEEDAFAAAEKRAEQSKDNPTFRASPPKWQFATWTVGKNGMGAYKFGGFYWDTYTATYVRKYNDGSAASGDGYWEYTPIYTYGTESYHVEREGRNVVLDSEGWELSNVEPAPKTMSVKSLLDEWGHIGIHGGDDYSGYGGDYLYLVPRADSTDAPSAPVPFQRSRRKPSLTPPASAKPDGDSSPTK